jgi:CheY-like chemotaxis protein
MLCRALDVPFQSSNTEFRKKLHDSLYVTPSVRLLGSPRMPGILIVDDNANIRHLLHSFIESNTGYQICGEAENGAQALERARKLQPDLVLLDLTLPGMTGTEAAIALKKEFPDVKIILFTFHADGVNQSLASTFHIDRVISKSDSIRTLGEHLKDLLPPWNGPTRQPGTTAGRTAKHDRPA